MTAPFTPANCDLRDFRFMPIDIVRLFGSDFHALSTDAEWRAGVTLWLRSYHQVPAASLPDDDIALARLAELGRDLKAWRKVRAGALRGWVKCDDGRLYHRTVAEKALEGWIEKLGQRKSSAAGNAKRYGQVFDPTPHDDAIDIGRGLLAALNPQSRTLSKRGGRQTTGTPVGTADDAPDGTPTGSPEPPPDDLPSGSQGTDKGQGQGIIRSSSLRSEDARAGANEAPTTPSGKPSTKPPRRHAFPPDAFQRWYDGYPHKVGRAAAEKAFERIRKADEVAFEILVGGVESYRRTKPPDRQWCNPTTWLNEARWADEPALSLVLPPTSTAEARIDFGGGYTAPHSTIRSVWGRGNWLSDWGPRPDQPGCRVPAETMQAIMDEQKAA